MIRLRDKKGKVLEKSDDLGFVEVCDLDGNVACAVYTTENGHIHFVTKESTESPRYQRIFNVNFTQIGTVPDILKD